MCHFDEKTQILQDPWHVDDVLNQRPDLTEDQACDVLDRLADNFDANIGINWEVIDSCAEYLFPKETAEDKEAAEKWALTAGTTGGHANE
jgi:hypothetical protein